MSMPDDSVAGAKAAQRFTFKKAERLCSQRLIEQLFQSGKVFNMYPLRFVFRRSVAGTSTLVIPIQVLFSVSKRHCKQAHKRNLIKRLLREAWRKEKSCFNGVHNLNLSIAVLYVGRENAPSLAILMSRFRNALNRLLSELTNVDSP